MKQLFANKLLVLILINILWTDVRADPRAIIYKGKVNIGLLIGAHSSNSTKSLCDTISVNGLYNAMANVWSLHKYNQRQRLNHFDEIGVFIYDTCDDSTVAKRQSVRLISHLFSIGNRICRESKGYPPLIGVIVYGRTFGPSLDLLSSFGIPIITTSEHPTNDQNSGNIFSVAPTLKYLSNAVLSFVKELDWQSVSMVVSDDGSSFDSQYLQTLALEGQFDFVKNYHNFDRNDGNKDLSDDYSQDNKEKIVSDYNRRRRIRRNDEIIPKNTIFFLNKFEAIDLLKTLTETSADNHAINSNYSCIIVTNSDISLEWRSIKNLKREEKLKSNIFLISPLIENTNEYQKYFETMVDTIGTKSDQPLISEYAKSTKTIDVPNMSVSAMTKAVWVLSEAYQDLYRKQCAGNPDNCNLRTNSNLTNMMTNSLRNLNSRIDGSGHKQLNHIKLSFDSEQQLISWKYQIITISSNWELINLGFYSHDMGLNIDTKLLMNIIFSRNKFHKTRSSTKTTAPRVRTNTYSSLSSNNIPLFKQAVYSFNNNSVSIPPSNLMRSSIRHQMSMSSSPIGKMTVLQHSSQPNTTTKPIFSEPSHVTRRRHSSLTAWLGNLWSMTILGTCILGILITLYVQTFLLLKSCEGALKKANQGLVICHLIAVMTTFLGSSLYVFYPTSFMCSVRQSTHNITLCLLFGSLLLRAMYIRAQKSIGLGGRASRLNQFLTLVFIIGIQTALELQKWKYESPWTSTKNSIYSTNFCSNDGSDYMRSQLYLSIILSLLLLMSWSARNTPFNQRDGTQVLIVSLLIAMVFIASMLLNINITKPNNRDIIISLSMNIYAFIVLLGLFVPLLYTIHKYGILWPKTSSYADSLSTIFTTFGGNHDLDNCSHNSVESRDSHYKRKHKLSKSFDFNNGNNFFARVSPNSYAIPMHSNHQNITSHQTRATLIPNPLYEGVPGFRSAYP